MVASRVPRTGDLGCNPGMCTDWESNRQPFGVQAGTQSTPARAVSPPVYQQSKKGTVNNPISGYP